MAGHRPRLMRRHPAGSPGCGAIANGCDAGALPVEARVQRLGRARPYIPFLLPGVSMKYQAPGATGPGLFLVMAIVLALSSAHVSAEPRKDSEPSSEAVLVAAAADRQIAIVLADEGRLLQVKPGDRLPGSARLIVAAVLDDRIHLRDASEHAVLVVVKGQRLPFETPAPAEASASILIPNPGRGTTRSADARERQP